MISKDALGEGVPLRVLLPFEMLIPAKLSRSAIRSVTDLANCRGLPDSPVS